MGKHYQLDHALNSPQSLSKPHPPILIGGMGEKRTLRLVAIYGNACNLFLRGGLETVRAKLDVLNKHCVEVGRDYNEIEKTTSEPSCSLRQYDCSKCDRVLPCPGQDRSTARHFQYAKCLEIKPLEIFGREIIPVVAGL